MLTGFKGLKKTDFFKTLVSATLCALLATLNDHSLLSLSRILQSRMFNIGIFCQAEKEKGTERESPYQTQR